MKIMIHVIKQCNSSTYIGIDIENNEKDAKFQVDDHVRISKNKNIFSKGCTPNRSEDVFAIKKVRNVVPWTYVIEHVNGKTIVGNS